MEIFLLFSSSFRLISYMCVCRKWLQKISFSFVLRSPVTLCLSHKKLTLKVDIQQIALCVRRTSSRLPIFTSIKELKLIDIFLIYFFFLPHFPLPLVRSLACGKRWNKKGKFNLALTGREKEKRTVSELPCLSFLDKKITSIYIFYELLHTAEKKNSK